MTAELTVLNQQAVALAADSAVTISTGRQQKVFNSVNKLFRLSLNKPVGVMVYGSASLFSVPWETIIKLYREENKDKSYSTLIEYPHCFLDFLTNNGYEFFPTNVQARYVEEISGGLSREARDFVLKEVKKSFDKKAPNDTEIKAIASVVIRGYYDNISNFKDVENDITTKEIRSLHYDLIGTIIDTTFEKLTIYKKDRDRLIKAIILYFTKDHFSQATSGIVFAGFGEKEFFPSLKAFKIDAIINNKPRFIDDGGANISFENRAQIRPFAQGSMVASFIEGIDPNQKFEIENYFSEILDKYTGIIVDELSVALPMSNTVKSNVSDAINKSSSELYNQFIQDLSGLRLNAHIRPILDMVAMLPKEELAVMAETLINLTSFKQKMTMGTETVGGPIDVAVITKGDGFSWIKRKGLKA